MILLGSSLIDTPIIGIQTSDEIARTEHAIIDPATLAIIAYRLTGNLLEKSDLLVRVADIRELSDLGFIVDSADEFVQPDDIVKLSEIINLNFDLINMPVTDENRRKLGKITDYTIETGSFIVQQLSVKRPLFQSLSDTELLIHRSQIIEINDDAIVVHSQAKIPEKDLNEVVGSYVNPFRKPKSIAPERIDITKDQ